MFAVGLGDALFLLVSTCKKDGTHSNPLIPMSRRPELAFWSARFLLNVAMAMWGAVQILRLPLLWGPNSVVAPSNVTAWTSQGWLCRIYLTASLGVACPIVCWLAFFLLTGSLRRLQLNSVHLGEIDGNRVSHSSLQLSRSCFSVDRSGIFEWPVTLTFIVSLPIAAGQAIVAWIDLTITHNGQPLEQDPRSLIGYFLAVFWYGNAEQCAVDFSQLGTEALENEYPCTMCVFPAAAVIIHVCWIVPYALLVWSVTTQLRAFQPKKAIMRKINLFTFWIIVACGLGAGCIGASIAFDPFAWINQGLWLGYFTTIMVSVFLVMYLVVDTPCSIQKDMDSNLNMIGTIQPMPPAPVFPVGGPLPSQRSVTFNPIEQVMPVNNGTKGDPGNYSGEEERFSDAESGYFTPRESPLKSLRSDSQMSCYYSIRSDTSLKP